MPVLKLNSNRKLRSAIAAVALGLLASFLVLQSENIELVIRLAWQKVAKNNTKAVDTLRQESAVRQFYTKLDTLAYDGLFQLRGPHEGARINTATGQLGVKPSIPEVVIVAIDDTAKANITSDNSAMKAYLDSIAKRRNYPFPRKMHAMLIRKLKSAGAAVIGLDLDFSDTSGYGTGDDHEFARALKESGNVVLIAKIASSHRDKFEYQAQSKDFPLPELRDAARSAQPASNPKDNLDSWIRRFHLTEDTYDPDDLTQLREYPTFATMIAALYWNDYFSNEPKFREISAKKFNDDVLRQLHKGQFAGNPLFFHHEDSQTLHDTSSVNVCYAGYPGSTTCETHGYDEVMDPKNARQLVNWFSNKIVLVGSQSEVEQDAYRTPLTRRSAVSSNKAEDVTTDFEADKRFGVEIHANIVHTLLSHHFYRDFPAFRSTSLIWVCGLVMAFLTVRLRPLFALLPYLAILGATALLVIAAWNQYQFLRPTQIVAAATLAYSLETVYFYAVEERRANQTRIHFQRYVGPAVMNKVLDTDFKPGSVESRYMTIMFTDVQGFTSLSEKISPEELVHTLNQYLDEMVDILYKYEGTLDKIMGDGVMAYFNAPFTVENHEQKAVLCALEMQARMHEWRKVSEEKGLPPLKVRVGIHSGVVVFGEVGAKKQVGFTVIGDAVNTAARLEPLNKQFGSEILISETVQQKLRDPIQTECVGELEIRGRKEGIRAYSVSARESSETNNTATG